MSNALFILLVEKDAAFMRLAEDRFYNTYPCIIITAKGQPDVASRCVTAMHICLRCIHHINAGPLSTVCRPGVAEQRMLSGVSSSMLRHPSCPTYITCSNGGRTLPAPCLQQPE